MSVGRTILRHTAIPVIVISAVFAVGFQTGKSATLSALQSECASLQGHWRNDICIGPEAHQ